MSPHAAAKREGLKIDIDDFKLPESNQQHLLLEGAGGLMVPLNDWLLMIDLIGHFDAEAIIVIKNYLGSINHSLLSIESLQRKNIPIKGIIFNGSSQLESEEIIQKFTDVPVLFHVPEFTKINKKTISDFAMTLPKDIL
jgi:dethiobiotin synthetase